MTSHPATPSRLHFAFAIALVQSKPPDLSVTEYISRLRAQLLPGRKQHDPHTVDRHLSAARYWQKRCAGVEAARDELQARVAELERKADSLQSQNAGPSSGTKRRGDAAESSSSRQSKKPKAPKNTSSSQQPNPTEATLQDDYETFGAVGIVGSTLVQHLYKAHKLIKTGVAPDKSIDTCALSHHVVHGSSALASVLDAACKEYQQRIGEALASSKTSNKKQKAAIFGPVLARHNDILFSTFTASTRAFGSLFYSVGKLSQAGATREERGTVIYALVASFSRMLDTLMDAATTQSEQEESSSDDTTSSARSNTAKQKAARAGQAALEVPKELSQVLLVIVTSPYTTDALHRELFEGFLFVLLERVGKWLYICTFGHDRCATIAEDIRAGAAALDAPPTPPEARAMRLSLPHLVRLLERAMAIAPQLVTPSASTTAKPKPVKPARAKSVNPSSSAGTARGAGLSLAAKNRLQQTLVNATFGTAGGADADADDELMDCLRMPRARGALGRDVAAALAVVEREKEGEGGVDVGGWFTGEVWRLLGWEILGWEGDW
ncbi:uncharacterized protein K452DRAFT_319634 [Aplosporella prunicola CBS 121167]|uniref:Uncharacterized protein n=1 Tax=Aplosporella prunicola CBS 121167 TaxID=1176127 RepID=A0A6A6BAZ4_9PEZI|nr:uncharacterized protein K452DRAFT_319634 [Aplosporella prunicola CBS 121167]KAF2140758.1 hypothetical protein K452DRAFT_319634 [Aplosporella prunicola CBS 121167]